MLAATWKIEIRDSLGAWQDVTESVRSLADGTTSADQVIPTCSLTFAADTSSLGALLDPETDRQLARIRITDGADVRYYLLEEHNGQVERGYRYPVVTGRAYAGRVIDWPRLTYTWPVDALASTIASQCCVQAVASQSGIAIPVSWQATLDPTIPGRLYEVVKKSRLEVLQELATACGARVRVSADGLGFEVVDVLAKTLSASAVRAYADALSLAYARERVDIPTNAVRVKGEVPEYAAGRLPVIRVQVLPDTIPADGASTATAVAQVLGTDGRPVRHAQVVDEPIDANSYTSIPVSGCYSVLGVWLNTGTQQAPVKGARIVPTTFAASSITVPTQATDLFIVSYVQAESVSWALTDWADHIDGEARSSTGALAVSTANAIGRVRGVYRATDTRRTGTNFYTGGSFTPNTTAITLGISPGATGTALIIDYDKYNGTPLSASISPSSSLVDANGIAESTIGSGAVLGVGVVTASALGQEGTATFSLTGSAVGSLTLTAEPARIRQLVTETRIVATVTGEAVSTAQATDENGRTVSYVETDQMIEAVYSIDLVGHTNEAVSHWINDTTAGTGKAYLNAAYNIGTTGAITYQGVQVLDEEADTSTLTAVLLKADGTAVTDGTSVLFTIVGRDTLGAALSAGSATTSGGEASVELEAGNNLGLVTVRATAGGYWAEVTVEITDQDLDATQAGTTTAAGTTGGWGPVRRSSATERADNEVEAGECSGRASLQANDSNDADGSVSGTRRLVDCDGNPIANQTVTLADGTVVTTGADGRFSFNTGSAGSNAFTVNGQRYSFEVAPQNSAARGGTRLECEDGTSVPW